MSAAGQQDPEQGVREVLAAAEAALEGCDTKRLPAALLKGPEQVRKRQQQRNPGP